MVPLGGPYSAVDRTLASYPAAPGLILGCPQKFSLNVAEFDRCTAQNSLPRLDNVNWTNLVLASDKLVLQKQNKWQGCLKTPKVFSKSKIKMQKSLLRFRNRFSSFSFSGFVIKSRDANELTITGSKSWKSVQEQFKAFAKKNYIKLKIASIFLFPT